MGVIHLWNILEPVKRTGDLTLLKGKTICVDLSVWICEAHGAKGLKENVLKPHLRNLFFRIWNFIRSGVNLVFVIDGDPPKVKWETIIKRAQARGLAAGRGRGQQAKGCAQPPRKVGRSNFRVWINECIALFKLLGVPYVESAGEAEALCAWMNAKGLVDGCITNDGDVFLYGGRNVYKDLSISTKDCSMVYYNMDDIETQLGLSRESLVSLAILLGCDYLPQGVPGVGKEMGLKLVHELNDIDILQRFNQWSTFQIQDSDISKIERAVKKKALRIPGFPNREVISEFLSPKLFKTKNLTIPQGYKCPNLKGMQEFFFKYLEWPEDYTREKILPLLTYWQMNKSSPGDGIDVMTPERIVKLRVQNRIECYEVMWNNENIGDACETSFTTIENKDMFVAVYPEVVKEFEAAQLEKKTKKQGKRKGNKAVKEDNDDIENLCEELDTLSLHTTSTTSHTSNKTAFHEPSQKPTENYQISKKSLKQDEPNDDRTFTNVDVNQIEDGKNAEDGVDNQGSQIGPDHSIVYVLDDDHNISSGSCDIPLPLSQRLTKIEVSTSSEHKVGIKKYDEKKNNYVLEKRPEEVNDDGTDDDDISDNDVDIYSSEFGSHGVNGDSDDNDGVDGDDISENEFHHNGVNDNDGDSDDDDGVDDVDISDDDDDDDRNGVIDNGDSDDGVDDDSSDNDFDSSGVNGNPVDSDDNGSVVRDIDANNAEDDDENGYGNRNENPKTEDHFKTDLFYKNDDPNNVIDLQQSPSCSQTPTSKINTAKQKMNISPYKEPHLSPPHFDATSLPGNVVGPGNLKDYGKHKYKVSGNGSISWKANVSKKGTVPTKFEIPEKDKVSGNGIIPATTNIPQNEKVHGNYVIPRKDIVSKKSMAPVYGEVPGKRIIPANVVTTGKNIVCIKSEKVYTSKSSRTRPGCIDKKKKPTILQCVEFSSSDSDGDDSWLNNDSRSTSKTLPKSIVKPGKQKDLGSVKQGMSLAKGTKKANPSSQEQNSHRGLGEVVKSRAGRVPNFSETIAVQPNNSENYNKDFHPSASISRSKSSQSNLKGSFKGSNHVFKDDKKPVSKPVKQELKPVNENLTDDYKVILLTPEKLQLNKEERATSSITEPSHSDSKVTFSSINERRGGSKDSKGTSGSLLEEKENHVESPLFVPMSLSERLGKHLHGRQNALSTLRTLSTNME